MRYQIFFKATALAALTLAVAACGDSSNNDHVGEGPGNGGGTPAQDSFFAAVSAVIASSPDDTEPREVDSITATTPEDSEPTALAS